MSSTTDVLRLLIALVEIAPICDEFNTAICADEIALISELDVRVKSAAVLSARFVGLRPDIPVIGDATEHSDIFHHHKKLYGYVISAVLLISLVNF